MSIGIDGARAVSPAEGGDTQDRSDGVGVVRSVRNRCSRSGWRATRSQSWPSVLMSWSAYMLIIAAVTGLGGDEVELGHDLDGERQRFRHPADLGAEAAQDTANLTIFLAFQHGPFGAEGRQPQPPR